MSSEDNIETNQIEVDPQQLNSSEVAADTTAQLPQTFGQQPNPNWSEPAAPFTNPTSPTSSSPTPPSPYPPRLKVVETPKFNLAGLVWMSLWALVACGGIALAMGIRFSLVPVFIAMLLVLALVLIVVAFLPSRNKN